MALDLEAIEARDAAMYERGPFAPSLAEEDRHALLAENRRLREALEPFAAKWREIGPVSRIVMDGADCKRAAEVLK